MLAVFFFFTQSDVFPVPSSRFSSTRAMRARARVCVCARRSMRRDVAACDTIVLLCHRPPTPRRPTCRLVAIPGAGGASGRCGGWTTDTSISGRVSSLLEAGVLGQCAPRPVVAAPLLSLVASLCPRMHLFDHCPLRKRASF